MHATKTTGAAVDPTAEDFAAELTETAYPVLLRQGVGDSWLDLQLELWRALTETVQKWERQRPRAGVLVCSLPPGD